MSLYNAVKSGVEGLFKREEVASDNLVFYFHSKVTVIMLVASSSIIAGFEYFGNPIECYSGSMSGDKTNEAKVLNVYCWISTTYSIPELWNATVGHEVVYPGVGNSYSETSRTYHSYYQWVVFVLYLQAIAFSVPKYLWSASENNLISSLTTKLRFTVMQPEKRLLKLQKLANYIEETRYQHKVFWFFVLCELLNLFNVISQIFLIDHFLNGKFWSLGTDFIRWTQQETEVSSELGHEMNLQYDPLLEVFPRMTKCTFHRFGSSGDLERFDAFCLLTINHVNEKVFIILWFWLHFLTLVSALYFIWRLGTIFFQDIRIMSMGLSCSIASRSNIETIISRCPFTDWFLLKMLARNIDDRNFDDLVKILLRQLPIAEESKKNTSHDDLTTSLSPSTR